MKFAHTIKHNGVVYLPGQEVPVGKEAVKVNEKTKELTNIVPLEEMKAGELSKYIKEKYDVDYPAQTGKAKLLDIIKEREAEANKGSEDSEIEDDETDTDTEEDEEESTEGDGNTEPDEESSNSDFVNGIINE